MSLSTLALRLLTVRALDGRTMAGANIFNSEMGAIDQKVGQRRAPFMLIYTDDEVQTINAAGLFDGNDQKKIRLVIECVVSEPGKTAQGEQGTTIPATDAMREMTLDLMRHQIVATLADTASPWSSLWRRLVTTVEKIEVIRGADDSNGIRFAAKQVAITLDTLSDPAPGEGLRDAWLAIVEAFEDHERTELAGQMIRASVEKPTGLADWRVAQEQLGVSDGCMAAIGLKPLASDDDGQPVPLSTVEIAVKEHSTVVSSDDIGDLLPDPPND